MARKEADLYESQHKEAYRPPSTATVVGTRIFELVCNLLTICLLAVTASGHQQLYYFIPHWITIGLVVSVVGTVVSTIFIIEHQFKYPLIEVFTSLLLSIGHLSFVIKGALNTPTDVECYHLLTQLDKDTCSSPKAAVFFSFVALMSYIFSASSALKYWYKMRSIPNVKIDQPKIIAIKEDKEKTEEKANVEIITKK